MALGATAILVDTHILLWTRLAPQMLTVGEREILDNASVCLLSVASLWELAILIGRRRLPGGDELFRVPDGFDLVMVSPEHCRALASLPWHHCDPFDRMLVAQAQVEQVPLLTRDRAMTAYHRHAVIVRHQAS